MNKYGFPCSQPKQPFNEWKAGDIIRVLYSKGKRKSTELVGRIKTAGLVQREITVLVSRNSFNPRDARPIHRSDGYRYLFDGV